MENLEKIIKYLDGELMDEEKISLENELIQNPKMQETIKLVKEIDQIISDEDMVNFITKLNQIKSDFNSESENKSHSINYLSKLISHNWFVYNKFLVAASIIVFIIISSVLYYNASPLSEKLFNQYYTAYDISVITRSNNSETDNLVIAIQLYDKKMYNEAIEKFNEILKTDKNNTAAHFFIGMAYMETRAFDKAIENLNEVITLQDTAFLEHAEWYLALCLLKTNQVLQAKNMVNQIKVSDSYYRAIATDLSKKL